MTALRTRRPLSAVVVVQDNEATVGPVVECAGRIADEIVVVDGGSRDATATIALRHEKVRLYRRPFDGSIARQKNFGCDQAHGDWILILDSDELLSAEAERRIPRLIRSRRLRWFKLPRRWVVRRDGRSYYLRSPKHFPDYQLRLFRNEAPFRYETGSPVHHHFPRRGRGRGRRLEGASIEHYDLVLNDRASREAKVERYRRLEPASEETSRVYLWEEQEVELVPFVPSGPGLGGADPDERRRDARTG